MAKKLAFALAFVLLACSKQEQQQLPPERDPIATEQVSVDNLAIHQKPDPASAVVSNRSAGESVSILSYKGDWAEVAVGAGESGWALKSDLSSGEGAASGVNALTPRFLKAPSPAFTQASVHGEIVLRATVSDQGTVQDVQTVSNTTGSDALALQNAQELRKAKFYPLFSHGKKVPFVYDYHVTY